MIASETRPGQSLDWRQAPSEEEGLTRYLRTLRERLWIVLATIAVTTGAAILYVATSEKTYEAQADMLVIPTPSSEQRSVNLPLLRESADPTRDVETASRLITNNEVAQRVREELGTDLSPEALLDSVEAQPIAQSDIVAVVARTGDPALARDVANGFAEQAIAAETAALHEYIDQALPGLEAQAQSGTANPSLQQEIAQLRVLRELPVPTLRVQTPATQPSGPASPRTKLSIAAGLLAGLILGVAAAFAIQILDPRLRREEQLRRLYRLPILARIPKESGNRDSAPLNPLALSPAASEAYRTLRGTLGVRRRGASGESRVILVTGSSPSEGKTTTAINLATSFAASGNSVILIEADLRRPAISRALDLRAKKGIISVLIESAALEDALLTTEAFGPSLGLLLADYQGGAIAELFGLPTARKMVDDARQLADYVIIDSPPLTDVIDALPLASYVDDVLVVVKLGRTTLAKLAQLGELLAENGIKPAGFAVVGTPRPARSDYHYYGEPSTKRTLQRAPATRGR